MIRYWLEQTLRGKRARTVLDIGPGYNTFAIDAARLTGARTVYYLDYSKEVLDWQAARCAEAGLDAVRLQADLNENTYTPLPGPFDLILCQEVLEHLPDAGPFLAHLVRHLADDGAMVITVPTKISERLITFLNPDYMKHEPYGHVNQFDRPGLRALMQSAGLRDETFLSIQPHYFLGHAWLFASRVPIEGASGRILTYDWRTRIFGWIVKGTRPVFHRLGPRFWGRCFPRNYFVLARRSAPSRPDAQP